MANRTLEKIYSLVKIRADKNGKAASPREKEIKTSQTKNLREKIRCKKTEKNLFPQKHIPYHGIFVNY